eukprot:87441-Amphidinium_carterae.1
MMKQTMFYSFVLGSMVAVISSRSKEVGPHRLCTTRREDTAALLSTTRLVLERGCQTFIASGFEVLKSNPSHRLVPFLPAMLDTWVPAIR